MFFGFKNSTDEEIQSMNAKAALMSFLYDNYETYCAERVSAIKDAIIYVGSIDGDDTTHRPSVDNTDYIVRVEGIPMEKEWFIAFHCVKCEDDLSRMGKQSIKDCVTQTILYRVEAILIEPDEGLDNTEDTTLRPEKDEN